MRRLIVLAAIAAALAGCGQRPENSGANAQNEAGLPTPGPRPSGSNTGTDLSAEQSLRQSYRTININSCISAARARAVRENNAPAGTDYRPYCTCAVDRLMAGRTMEELTRLRPGPREQEIAEICGRENGMLIDSGASGGK